MNGDRLPNAGGAVVAERKLVEYLLSDVHPDGHGKARFFVGHGFSPAHWEVLASAFQVHAGKHRVAESQATEFGTRYIIDGELETPDGRRPIVRVVWFIRTGRDVPEFVTAYPVKRRL